MKVKVGQKIRIGKTPACQAALRQFYLGSDVGRLVGRVAYVNTITCFLDLPAVHLNFPGKRPLGDDNTDIYYPVAALRKP